MLDIIGLRWGGRVGSARFFRYQHVGISNHDRVVFHIAVEYMLHIYHGPVSLGQYTSLGLQCGAHTASSMFLITLPVLCKTFNLKFHEYS